MLLKVRDELGEFGCPGIVLRTNSGSVPEAAVEEELFSLTAKLKTLLTGAVHRTCFSCLYRTPPGWLNRLLSLHASETERIVVEDAGLYQQAMDFLGEYSESLKERLVHYQDDLLPMHKLYSLERELEEALAERIWMKSRRLSGGAAYRSPHRDRCEYGKIRKGKRKGRGRFKDQSGSGQRDGQTDAAAQSLRHRDCRFHQYGTGVFQTEGAGRTAGDACPGIPSRPM